MPLRFPKLFNLRSDPFETVDHESIDYGRWRRLLALALEKDIRWIGVFARRRQGRPLES